MKGDLAARERSRRSGGDAGQAGEEGMRDGGSDKVNAGRERAEDHAGRALPRAAFPQFLAALAHVAARNREAAAEAAADNLLI